MRKQYFGVYGEGDVKVCILKSWPQNEVYGEYGVKVYMVSKCILKSWDENEVCDQYGV